MDLFQIIKKPLITEKSARLKEKHHQYGFAVALEADKDQIREAVEQLFKVHVTDIQTMRVRGKWRRVGKGFGRRSNWKKAFVTLREGEKIEAFDAN